MTLVLIKSHGRSRWKETMIRPECMQLGTENIKKINETKRLFF
jgi:hypothetical protein